MVKTNPENTSIPTAEVPSQPSPTPESITEKKPDKRLPILILIIVAVLAVGTTAFFALKNYQLKRKISQLTPKILYPTTQTPSQESLLSTDGWQTVTVQAVGLEFKIPPEIHQYGDLQEKLTPGEKGNNLCVTFPKIQSGLIKSVLAGGTGCVINVFGLSSNSVDFQAGREAGFSDYQGYISRNSKHYAKLLDKEIEIPARLTKEFVNPNSIEILRVIGEDMTEEPYWPLSGTPGKGWLGALINIPDNTTYPGVAIQMGLKDDLTESLFDQILSTFKLTLTAQNNESESKPTKVSQQYFSGEISPRVPYNGLKFVEIDVHGFLPLKAELNQDDYRFQDAVMDGYTFVANQGEDFEFIAEEDRSSNPASFIETELYGWGPTVIKMGTVIGWGVPATTRYFYVIKGQDFYGSNYSKPGVTPFDGSKYGSYTLRITQRK